MAGPPSRAADASGAARGKFASRSRAFPGKNEAVRCYVSEPAGEAALRTPCRESAKLHGMPAVKRTSSWLLSTQGRVRGHGATGKKRVSTDAKLFPQPNEKKKNLGGGPTLRTKYPHFSLDIKHQQIIFHH